MDPDAYVKLAVRYATEPAMRDELGALRPAMRRLLTESKVCDVAGFARQMDDLLWSAIVLVASGHLCINDRTPGAILLGKLFIAGPDECLIN